MKIKLVIQNQEREIWSQWIQGELWYHLDGESRVYQPESTKARATKKTGLDIISPMPGKVTKVFVQDKDPIKAGQIVLVMEAMKMEYTLKAEQDCQVLKLSCKTGDQVKLGQILVKMNAAVNSQDGIKHEK